MGIHTPDLTPVDPGVPRIEVATPEWPQEIWGPHVRQIDERLWEIVAPYSIATPVGTFNIPAGFRFDLASVPRIAWTVIGAPFQYGKAAPVCHDLTYHYGGNVPWGMITPWRPFSRHEADKLFLEMMTAERVPTVRRRLAYHAVRLFGSGAWAERIKGQGRNHG